MKNYDLFILLRVRAYNQINRNISEYRHNPKTLHLVYFQPWLYCQKIAGPE